MPGAASFRAEGLTLFCLKGGPKEDSQFRIGKSKSFATAYLRPTEKPLYSVEVMKSRQDSPRTSSKKAVAKPTYSAVLTDIIRSAWRASRYAFVAGAGI